MLEKWVGFNILGKLALIFSALVICPVLDCNHYYFLSVVLGCGGTASNNCTYFQSSSTTQASGQCAIKICKCSSDICQVSV
jgi:hypothetical protein